jgi:hypothetical protein
MPFSNADDAPLVRVDYKPIVEKRFRITLVPLAITEQKRTITITAVEKRGMTYTAAKTYVDAGVGTDVQGHVQGPSGGGHYTGRLTSKVEGAWEDV